MRFLILTLLLIHGCLEKVASSSCWKDQQCLKSYYLDTVEKIKKGAFLDAIDKACSQSKLIVNTKRVTSLRYPLTAHILIERLRNSFEQSKEKKNFFLSTYSNQCIPVLKPIVHQSPLSLLHTEKANQIIAGHARSLLDFSIEQIPHENMINSLSYIHSVDWLYYNFISEHNKGEQAARLAIKYHSPQHALLSLAEKYSFLGTSLYHQGRFQESLFYTRKGLAETISNSPSEKYSDAYFSLAFLYLKLGEYASAQRFFRVALDLDDPLGLTKDKKADCSHYPIEAAKSIVQLGVIERKIGNTEGALEYHNCAIKALTKANDYYYYVALLEKAKDLLASRRYRETVITTEKLLENETLLDSHRLTALSMLFEVELALTPLKPNQSIQYEIYNLLRDKEAQQLKIEFLYFLRLKLRFSSLTRDVKSFTDHAVAGFKHIENINSSGTGVDAWFFEQNKFVEEYIYWINTLKEINEENKFWLTIKALDLHNTNKYHINRATQASTSSKHHLRKWVEAEIELLALGSSNQKNKQIVVDEAKEQYLSHSDVFIKEQYLPQQDNYERYTLKQFQSKISPDTMIVRYFIRESVQIAAVLTRERAKLAKLDLDPNSVKNFLNRLSSGDLLSQNLKSISKKVIPFINPKIKKLVIIPDEELHRLPFSALDSNLEKRRYLPLAKSMQVLRTSSISNYLFSDRKKVDGSVNKSIFVFADPIWEKPVTAITGNKRSKIDATYRDWFAGLNRLPYSKMEAKSIEQIFSQKQVQLRLSNEFTIEAIMSKEARSAQVLHIATHGYYNSSTPDIVGIATSSTSDQSGFLSLTKLLSKPFSSKLVVISGCETMLGENYKGNGMRSLTNGFLRNGAKSVLSTLWKIPDKSTSDFMTSFYEALNENGGDSALALHHAKLSLLKSNYYRNPYYWASFVLITLSQYDEVLNI